MGVVEARLPLFENVALSKLVDNCFNKKIWVLILLPVTVKKNTSIGIELLLSLYSQ